MKNPALTTAQAIYQILTEKPSVIEATRRDLKAINGVDGDGNYSNAEAILSDETIRQAFGYFKERIAHDERVLEQMQIENQRLARELAESRAEIEEKEA